MSDELSRKIAERLGYSENEFGVYSPERGWFMSHWPTLSEMMPEMLENILIKYVVRVERAAESVFVDLTPNHSVVDSEMATPPDISTNEPSLDEAVALAYTKMENL